MNDNAKICLVCSSGGHLLELLSLKDFWSSYSRFWVTFEKDDVAFLLKTEVVYFAYHPTIRNIKNFIKNMLLAFKILKKESPQCVISTGAGVGVPFIYLAKLFKIKTIYIESMTRVEKLSLTGRLVYRVSDHFLVQWPELAHKYKRATYQGQII